MKNIKVSKIIKFGIATMIGFFMASAASSFECKEKRTSMAKPSGFPSRALTMIVPYGPGGGSGQIAAAMA
ncbi:MAG: tripartite tricarboxylate transporter substrate binding protein, partial [SAR324 cluster bacterium]|nr:tripartite tricarboxylate transporter substrate binding protein [SAR324 cluster bacterium]